MKRVLVLATPRFYGGLVDRCLSDAGYAVRVENPRNYSGLHEPLPNLVLQDAEVVRPGIGRGQIISSGVDVTRKVVEDIQKLGASIEMLVVNQFVQRQSLNNYRREKINSSTTK